MVHPAAFSKHPQVGGISGLGPLAVSFKRVLQVIFVETVKHYNAHLRDVFLRTARLLSAVLAVRVCG